MDWGGGGGEKNNQKCLSQTPLKHHRSARHFRLPFLLWSRRPCLKWGFYPLPLSVCIPFYFLTTFYFFFNSLGGRHWWAHARRSIFLFRPAITRCRRDVLVYTFESAVLLSNQFHCYIFNFTEHALDKINSNWKRLMYLYRKSCFMMRKVHRVCA